ncbi:MAG: aspartate--tRNA ligase [Proteobacteria bacterium]|nr:aspartate--tRNA ligase [Pseudomonadota bacterium]
MNTYRTHTCSSLGIKNVSEKVKLSGWIYRRRDHGGVVFIDLRDNFGVTQLVINPESNLIDNVSNLGLESVITIEGEVLKRNDAQINPEMSTGEIEVNVTGVTVLSEVESLPWSLIDESIPEELRLRDRVLDLRTQSLHKITHLRSNVIKSMREHMWSHEFHEFQTPILTASSPEGARDFLVPSRITPGTFYALPQAPQQFKQMLMVAGFDKYFQVAPCFRDEDPRADRHPGEFYQLDVEMSFVNQDEVLSFGEDLLTNIFSKFKPKDSKLDKAPFRRIPFEEAMLKYASDKPDLRNPIEIFDISKVWLDSDFAVFKSIVEQGGVVRAIPAKKAGVKPRSWFDKLGKYAQKELRMPAAPGYIVKQEDGSYKGPLVKFLKHEQIDAIFAEGGLTETNDTIFLVAGNTKDIMTPLGKLRNRIGSDLELTETDAYRFCWIVDFPIYEEDKKTGKIDFSHNPFSMPQGGINDLETKNPLDVKGWQYDSVCNGYELASGAIRNYDIPTLFKTFEIAGYTKEEVEENFKGMLKTFRLGVPPHGGFAFGIERIIMLLTKETNIRRVITFPLNGKAQCLLTGAPIEATETQMQELYIKHNNLPQPQADLVE